MFSKKVEKPLFVIKVLYMRPLKATSPQFLKSFHNSFAREILR